MAHLTRTLATLLALGLAAAPAFARQPPPAPPSGIVVHLFGPDSLSSHILPSLPAASPKPGNTAATASGASGNSVGGSAPMNGTAPAASGPTWGDVAHQMFVTGDPAEEGAAALPKGKAATQ